jgi:hypothetical protein
VAHRPRGQVQLRRHGDGECRATPCEALHLAAQRRDPLAHAGEPVAVRRLAAHPVVGDLEHHLPVQRCSAREQWRAIA